ncbi:MAG TPA: 16S rRNA (guanine(527)-N(7))-methyltransferase RsmG [Solirubrobacterales bacterium]|nr:16S rRNA (guanine(527)-N(7))-methyltransferase RsmG [Solirubrobacterales bacterium]
MSEQPGVKGLSADARAALDAIVGSVSADERAPSSVRDPAEAWRVHIADSLAGLEFRELRDASAIGDLGAGAGFPGLPLAVTLPAARVDLIESTGRKCAFMRRTIDAAAIGNARVVCERSEEWASDPPPDGGREAYDVVVARAVGRLATLAELASPLLGSAGVLLAWKGRRHPDEEAELERAVEMVGMEPEEVLWVGPYAGSRNRHLHLLRKHGATPDGLPRRPGMAKKRPFGS